MTQKVRKIAHLADIHLRKTPTRNVEYLEVFDKLYESLKKESPDRIVIVGDLFNDYLTLDTEQIVIAYNFLNKLSSIAPVRITKGNHDCLKTNINRKDSVSAIVETLNNNNIVYYNETGFFKDDNICWVVWNHGDKDPNPWRIREGKKILKEKASSKDNDNIFIDLFHDPINGGVADNGFDLNSKKYFKSSDFKGDYLMAGDIHKKQYLNKTKTQAYCGSLIAQKFSEGDNNFHGYLLWDVIDNTVKECAVHNDYSYKNIVITPYTDFNDLDIVIENPTKYMKVRLLWKTLPSTRNKENERLVVSHLKLRYDNISISHKNEFIEEDKVQHIDEEKLQNINDKGVQQEIFKEYLEKIGVENDVIIEILSLDDEISRMVDTQEELNIEWDIVKFGGNNFMSYEKFDIDWRDMEGIFQIVGDNATGKTTLIFKFLPYMLYGKTLETESRMKFGDSRFVNNRNNATSCDGYLVLDVNGEYFGIKKETKIEKSKSGEIKGAPTKMSYYLLSTPDDEMTDENSFEKMDEEKRQKTQSRLESVIGSYDNFMRVVMTTSDTLNKILSNDMAVFTDSLLYESGLDIFDKKLESLKKYEKDVADKGRITCDVEFTENRNNDHREKIKALNSEIFECENTLIPSITESIEKGRTYIEDLNKKLYNIDPEIYNLNVDQVKTNIIKYQTDINDWVIKRERLENSISLLKTTYDKERLEYLESLKIKHKDDEFALKMKIRDHEQNISKYSHDIEIINGEIIKLKERGGKIKLEIDKLKESKTCPTCGQPMTIEHQTHVEGVIREKTTEMLGVRDEIVLREGNIPNIRSVIENEKLSINVIQNSINELNKGFDNTLKEIGEILNDKNDTDKRNSVMVEISLIPSEIEKCQLNIQILQQKVDMYNNSQQQIGENQKTEKIIAAAKAKILDYENERSLLSNKVFGLKQTINDHMRTIELNEETITKFKEQERRDNILKLYKKCVHRDGIPKQMLSNYVIPKANATLGEILLESPFKVWLDEDDLRPKLVYNDIPESVIDCLGASGKERTFSSIVLKFALNRNNVKSRPHIFLLDEIMGKLDSKSVEEFIDILHMIKSYMRRVVIVEHVHQINPDYIINIFIDENKISHAVIN